MPVARNSFVSSSFLIDLFSCHSLHYTLYIRLARVKPFRFGFPVQALHAVAVRLKGTAREARLLWLCDSVAPLPKSKPSKAATAQHMHCEAFGSSSSIQLELIPACLSVLFAAP